MSFPITLRADLIKTKRSAAFWLCFLGAGFIPSIFLIGYLAKPQQAIERMKTLPWESHFQNGWQSFATFLLPMFIIIVCSQIIQIEYKNNTWKQVFASPQSLANIFLSKLVTIMVMTLFLFLMFNFFMVGCAVLVNLIHKDFTFLDNTPKWGLLLKMNVKTFVALLGIIAIQYWLSLRIKNFIVPIAIGLALLIGATILFSLWEHVDKYPYAFPILSFFSNSGGGSKKIEFQNHELNSIGWFITITVLAFLDLKYRKERG
jgi:lantibiotic transport system permease protein